MIFMGIDYVTGLIVAGVFHNSEKTTNGALESRVGWKGLCRKGVTLLIVLVGCRLDVVMGSNFIRDAVVIAFIVNETISIIENAGLMPSFSKITPTPQAFNIRTASKQSTVFLANRETDLTIMMSMPPCLQAVSILLNSF